MSQTARKIEDGKDDDAGAHGIRIERTTHPRPRPDPAHPPHFGEAFTDHMFMLEHAGGRWRAPRIVPLQDISLHPAAAVLHYAQAVFEGLKAVRGQDGRVRIFRLDRHCRRLVKSATRLCIPPPPPALLNEALLTLVHVERDWVPEGRGTALYLRPTLIATEPFLGVRPAEEYLFFVIASPIGAYFGRHATLRIFVEDTLTRAAPGGLGGVKAGANYAASLRGAEDARRAGWNQVLWTDGSDEGGLQEVGTMNLFVAFDDEVATPPLDGTILGGVTRDAVITLLRRAGHRVRERRITIQELLSARRTGRLREVFGTGTAAGVAAVGELGWRDQRIVVGDGGAGPIARHMATALEDIQIGAAEDTEGWMTDVG
jgi:branched-chain amino acid aminotransferase